jgi:tRNA pseudouridine55 synthase
VTGVVPLLKVPGPSSQQAVAAVRRLARVKRAGHAGTLDPEAAGVLLVCLGPATRLAGYLMAQPKSYRALVRFGVATDTLDAAGRVLAVREPTVRPGDVEGALPRFVGEIRQVPPAYSALKRGGRAAYRLARAGEAVDLEPRTVHVGSIRLVRWQEPAGAWLDVECGSGFYVRALARDLGEAVGCPAHLAVLIRTGCGGMRLEDARTLEELASDGVESALVPPAEALGFLPAVVLAADAAEAVRHGVQVAGLPLQRSRLLDGDGRLVGVAAGGRLEKVWS